MNEYLPALFVFMGAAICIWLPVRMRRKRKLIDRQNPSPPVREQWEERNRAMEVERSADRILVELVETSREISARMDTKIRILNTLIRNAERCIERLEELQDSAPRKASTIQKDSKQPISSSPAAESIHTSRDMPFDESDAEMSETNAALLLQKEARRSADALREELQQRRKSIRQRQRVLQQTPSPRSVSSEEDDDIMGSVSASETPAPLSASTSAVDEPTTPVPSPAESAEDCPTGELHNRVVTLHQQGYSVPEIARDVHLSRQEVNLILHLKQTLS